jgi:hypothetical protein
MHGYFMSLKLYDAARLIANPFAYAEYRDKMVREKMEKMAETRIRTKKEVGVKVNKALAEKILREEEKAKKREQRRKQKSERTEVEMDIDEEHPEHEVESAEKPSILSDPRFAEVFKNPEFAIDENTREYALLNPSAAAQKRSGEGGKTAVEDEEDESDKFSSDGLDDSESESDGDDDGSDSSDAGGRHPLLHSSTSSKCYCRTHQVRPSSPAGTEERSRPGGIQSNTRAKPRFQCQFCPYARAERCERVPQYQQKCYFRPAADRKDDGSDLVRWETRSFRASSQWRRRHGGELGAVFVFWT